MRNGRGVLTSASALCVSTMALRACPAFSSEDSVCGSKGGVNKRDTEGVNGDGDPRRGKQRKKGKGKNKENVWCRLTESNDG